MKVPLVDLRAGYEPIRAELRRRFEEALEGMQLFLGPNVQAFEREFTDYCEAANGVGLSSGTDALLAALRALGVGSGDEVVLPSLTFFATVEAVVHVGAVPVFVDVSPGTLTMDPERAAAAIGPRTKAILPVHLYGHPADMDPILSAARERGVLVLEDCAQAHGARYKGRRCGSLGDASAFSFYFTKNLGAYGEAGFVTTPHERVAEAVRELRHHGHVSKFEHARMGYNLRLDELQAVVLRVKLPSLDGQNERRAEVAARYDALLADLPLERLRPRPGCVPVHHLYPVLLPAARAGGGEGAGLREELRAFLDSRGVGTGIHYKVPAHRQPALAGVRHRSADLPVTEAAGARLLSLPMYPELSPAQVEHVAGSIGEFLQARGAAATGT